PRAEPRRQRVRRPPGPPPTATTVTSLHVAVDQDRPIGVFDSGVGGLTVARALHERLPGESLLYFGDTARVPYGSKSPETVRRFSREAANFLLSRDIKLLVIACN